jgi:hypothetical protein
LVYDHILPLFHKLDKKTDKWYRGRFIVKSLEFLVTFLIFQHSKRLRLREVKNRNYKFWLLLAFFCIIGAAIGSIPRSQSSNFIINVSMPTVTSYVIGYPSYITVVMSVELYGAIKEVNQLRQSIPLRSGLASFMSWAAAFTDLQSSLHSWTSRHRLAVSTYLVQTILHLVLLFLSTTFDISGLLPFSPSCTQWKYFLVTRIGFLLLLLASFPALMLLIVSLLAGIVELRLTRCVHDYYEIEVIKLIQKEDNLVISSEFMACVKFWQETKLGIVLYGLHIRFGVFLTLVGLIASNAVSLLIKHL